jgi:hypothetical protein
MNLKLGMILILLPLFFFSTFGGSAQLSWAVQRHTLLPSGQTDTGSGQRKLESSDTALAMSQVPPTAADTGHEGASQQPQEIHPPQMTAPENKTAPLEGGAHSPSDVAHGSAKSTDTPAQSNHGAATEHGKAQGSHGPTLPELSSTPGVTFVDTMIKLLDDEVNGRTFGWRPNDLLFGRFTDNVNNYQLGVLEALRFTTIRLKDSLTRMGDSDSYDPDLEQALNLLMNRSTLFWFPSAETAYGEALDHLRKFSVKLQRGERNFYYRKDNLQALLNAYKDLLGNINRTLIVPTSWFQADDYFYYAKGVAHVYYEILLVVRVGFEAPLSSTLHARDIMDEVLHELHRVEQMDPWIIMDGALDGLTANHRANMNGPLSEVAHLLGTLSQF